MDTVDASASLKIKKRLDNYITEKFQIYGPGGGYIFNTGHFVQPDTPPSRLIRAYTLANQTGSELWFSKSRIMSDFNLNVPDGTLWIGWDHAFDLREVYLRFRSPADWVLDRRPDSAEFFITADSRYKLWVNGQYVARGPARGWPHAQVIDRLDIAPYLQAGPNLLAVQVSQPGYSHLFPRVHRGAAGVLAYLVCDGEILLATDPSWRTRLDPSFSSMTPRMSIYQAGVEQIDQNLAVDRMQVGFDDTGWAMPVPVAPAYGYPWTDIKPRSVPSAGRAGV